MHLDHEYQTLLESDQVWKIIDTTENNHLKNEHSCTEVYNRQWECYKFFPSRKKNLSKQDFENQCKRTSRS